MKTMNTMLAAVGLLLTSLVILPSEAEASCTGANVDGHCYGYLTNCNPGGTGVGHGGVGGNGYYEWCYASLQTNLGSFVGVCTNTENVAMVDCYGVYSASHGTCVAHVVYTPSGEFSYYSCIV